VRRITQFRHDCEDYSDTSATGRFRRRSLLRAALFGSDTTPWSRPPLSERTVVTGQLIDVSPHALTLRTSAGEQRLTLTPDTKAWRGGATAPAALREGDDVILRTSRHPQAVERIWAQIGRVTGTITESRGRELIVDEGPPRGRRLVIMDEGSLRQIQVRFPRIAPGYLIDLIGLRHPGHLLAMTPATAQPPYRADHPPESPLVNGHIPDQVNGTAVWHEPGNEPSGLSGVAYLALDPETGCEAHGEQEPREKNDPHNTGPGCIRLPYLSIGSAVSVRNECTDITVTLPVTSCGAASRLFCDRCVECGTSPRGRIADLTMTAFAELGGDLEDGCFNASLTVPR
jgi:hypothetical protein